MVKLPEPPAVAAMRSITPDVEMFPAGTKLYRIYFRDGRHPGGWNRFRNFGPLPNVRSDHHSEEPPRTQERTILYARPGMMPSPSASQKCSRRRGL
jgi:hypothetical protein